MTPTSTSVPQRKRSAGTIDYYTTDAAAHFLDIDPRRIVRELEPTARLMPTRGSKTRPLYSRADLIQYARRIGTGVPA